MNNASNQPDDNNFAKGFKDGEPDLYFFNFDGYSGKFYFNDDRTPILVPGADFKIQQTLVIGSGFTGFIITTPNGNKYYFGKTGNTGPLDPIESTTAATIQNGASTANAAPSAWYLNKIVSADRTDSISLIYASENYSYYTLSLHPVLGSYYQPTDPTKNGISVVKNFVQGVRLSQIIFANGSITFTRAASPRTDLTAGSAVDNSLNDATNTSSYALGSITISDNNGFCKKDSLYYGYFLDNSSLNSTTFAPFSIFNLRSDKYKLRLDSIQEVSCNSAIKLPPYKFNYFTNQFQED